MNQPLLRLDEMAINIVSGRDKGISYKLVGEVVKIGRAPDNDVVLDDVKSSRLHARIEKRGQDYWIVDNGSQNGFYVNGIQLTEKQLLVGDKIVIGTTSMVFGAPSPAFPKTPSLKSIPSLPPQLRKKESGSKMAPIIIGMITIGAVVFLIGNHNAKKKEFKINDDAAVNVEIETISKSNETTQQEIFKKGKDTQQYAEAQAFYQRGFREFRETNYSRAIQYFETALTLYPSHPLAKRYLSRSRLKLNEDITAALERGEKYFQNQKYINAFDEYRTVLLLVNDPSNKNAQLAQKRIEAIQLIMMNNR